MQYFGSNIVEVWKESWVEAETSWVEVDGAGWSLVHGLVIPLLKSHFGMGYILHITLNLLHIFRTPFPRNISELLSLLNVVSKHKIFCNQAIIFSIIKDNETNLAKDFSQKILRCYFFISIASYTA